MMEASYSELGCWWGCFSREGEVGAGEDRVAGVMCVGG